MLLVQDSLEEGQGTVGIAVNIKHLKASRIGVSVSAKAVLKEIDGSRLVFDLQVYEGEKRIGSGEHQRFIIDEAKFLSRL
jgi:predicted thioesterase